MIRTLLPALPILLGVATVLTISMGLRQSLGLFLPPLTRDLSIAVADFTVAIAIQNLAWGFLQPIAGALATRLGFRPLMMAGAILYVGGLAMLATAQGLFGVVVGAGLMIGLSLACTGSAIALAVASRAVPASVRSTVLGMVTAAGSLGSVLAAPMGQLLSDGYGWRVGVVSFLVLALGMVPAAWFAGRVDRIPLPPRAAGTLGDTSMKAALATAMSNNSFLIMAAAYFVCGMQLVFLTTHLPAYLALCGMDPMLSAQALTAIAVFNVAGSLFFGWAGSRWSQQTLLGAIYTSRSIILAFYFILPPTPLGTLVFASLMGFLWMGVGPLMAGAVAAMFGLRWQAMIQGLAFMSHQLGSFVGAFGGGVIFDALGSYDLAWKLGVGLGLVAGILQLIFAAPRRPPPPPRLDPALSAG
ncbi:MAG: MFS transporter [Alphaproteobacteria bacterium]|nr:MFS transporter [Alphaproteobacteria bacterium]